jgi:hypothetical protein
MGEGLDIKGAAPAGPGRPERAAGEPASDSAPADDPATKRGPASFVIVDGLSPGSSASATNKPAPASRRVPELSGVWSGTRRRRASLRFGEHAMRLGTLTRATIDDALRAQKRHQDLSGSGALRLGELLLVRGDLRPETYTRVMKAAVPSEASHGPRALTLERLGAILVEEQLLEPARLRDALTARLRRERQTGVRPLLSRFLVQQKLVSERDVTRAEKILRRRTAFDQLARQRQRERHLPAVEAFLRANLERSGLRHEQIGRALRARDEAQELLGRRICLGETLVIRGVVDPHVYHALLERHLTERTERHRPLPHLVTEMVDANVVLAEHALWVSDVLQGRSRTEPAAVELLEGLVDAGFIAQREAAPYIRRALMRQRTRAGAAAAAAVLAVALGLWYLLFLGGTGASTERAQTDPLDELRAQAAAEAGVETMVAQLEARAKGPNGVKPLVGSTPQGARWRAMALEIEADTWRVLSFGNSGGTQVVREALAQARRTAARRGIEDMEPSHTERRLEIKPLGAPPSAPVNGG